ncbi:MAG: SPOR domain-containing protein, partial [Longimicrobiales bacterium]
MKLDEARVLLGLRPGFSESEFRAAAEGATRDWWPERFPEGSEYRRVAEERTRTIQQACLVLEGALTSSPRDSERELDNTEPPSVSPDTITPPVSLDSTVVDGVQPQGVTPWSVPGRGRTYRALGSVLVLVLGGAAVFGIWSQLDSGTDSSLRNGTEEERGFDLSAPVSPEAAAVDTSPATVTLKDSLETRLESADSNRVYYSVGLGAFQDQDAARSLLTRVQALEPSVWAVIAPVDVSGTLYFRVMVGLAGAPDALADVVQAVTRGIGRD